MSTINCLQHPWALVGFFHLYRIKMFIILVKNMIPYSLSEFNTMFLNCFLQDALTCLRVLMCFYHMFCIKYNFSCFHVIPESSLVYWVSLCWYFCNWTQISRQAKQDKTGRQHSEGKLQSDIEQWCRKHYILGEGTISGVRNWILWGVKRRKGNWLLFPLPVEVRVVKLTDWGENSEIQLDHQIVHGRTTSRFVLWKLVSLTCPYAVIITKIQN
jgi:hypothetical protein